jgi:hypothetical protein
MVVANSRGYSRCLKAASAEEHWLLTWTHESFKGRKPLNDCEAPFYACCSNWHFSPLCLSACLSHPLPLPSIHPSIYPFIYLYLSVLKTPRLKLFTLQLNQPIFSPLSLSDHQGVNLSTKTYNFQDVVPVTSENQGSGTGILSCS